jgi:rare lipoprotein A (peptidoglycan hydrolase)
MKKLLMIATLFLLSTQTASACDNWPSCTFTNKPETVVETDNRSLKKQTKTKRTKVERAPSIRDVPIIGDVVGVFQSGLASFYWQPQGIACGPGRFNPEAFTAAHRTLKCGTRVKVTNKTNGKSVVVTINDRGPFIAGRIIDLSRAAARAISMEKAGVVPVVLSRM